MFYDFDAKYAVHEGRTKYYQVFHILNDVSGDGVVVTHWGSYTPGAPRAPKLHAKGIKVDVYKRRSSNSNSMRIVRDKTKRGYQDWNSINKTLPTSADLRAELEQWFKPGDVDLIYAHLTQEVLPNEDDNAPNDDGLLDAMRAAIDAQAEEKQIQSNMQNKNWGIF